VSKRSGSGLSSLLLVAAVVAAVVVLAGIFPFRQIIASNRSVDLAEEQLAAIQEENLRLEARIEALQSTEEVERLAREQFGLVMPGEIGYVVTAPPGEAPVPEPEPVAEPAQREWWETVWDFLTGRDLAGDG
jgi:cell division protein FtsB